MIKKITTVGLAALFFTLIIIPVAGQDSWPMYHHGFLIGGRLLINFPRE